MSKVIAIMAIAIVPILACATSTSNAPANVIGPASVTPPDLAGYRLVDEGELGPDRDELRPYVRQVPLLLLTQWDEPQLRMGSYELVIFRDGSVFFEGRHHVDAIGFRTTRLANDKLAALLDELARTCPTLSKAMTCSDSTHVSMECHLASGDFEGQDGCNDDARDHLTITAVRRVVELMGVSAWVARDADGQVRYAGGDIERTLRPTPWKRYAPTPRWDKTAPGVSAKIAP
jgi:hypothetical protein